MVEDKTVLKGGECPWCHHNKYKPGVLWMAACVAVKDSQKLVFKPTPVFCSHCPEGKLRQKEEDLRDLLRNKR